MIFSLNFIKVTLSTKPIYRALYMNFDINSNKHNCNEINRNNLGNTYVKYSFASDNIVHEIFRNVQVVDTKPLI